MTYVRIEREFAGHTLTIETGNLAKQADGAVVVTYGDTCVLGCIQSAKAREGLDFFPLTVDYREKTYAAGKFPGGFFKREARPTQKEILTCRIIDRPLRPMFPNGYKEDVQVMLIVLSFDGEVDPDIVAMIAAFAAVNVSPIPFAGLMGACRVGYVDGAIVINPSCTQISTGESKPQSGLPGGESGRANRNPCAQRTPAPARVSSSSWLSTPSATTIMPVLSANRPIVEISSRLIGSRCTLKGRRDDFDLYS